MDYLDIRKICHSSFAEEEKLRRKSQIKPINKDFLDDLPVQVRNLMDELCWTYKDQPWFEEAWEKYRKHVLDVGLGGKIKMPGFVFNEYIDRYVDELEKKNGYTLAHMNACDIEDLYHYGIKGQKWGIRRYQNEDGSFTAEGKARYKVDSSGKPTGSGLEKFKLDQRSIEGQRLYEKGQTIDKIKVKRAIEGSVLGGIAGYTITKAFQGTSLNRVIDVGEFRTRSMLAGIGAASVAGVIALKVKTNSDIKKLKAYYANGSHQYHEIQKKDTKK